MSRNDARDYADRLYARIPAHYRVYDAERGQPLYALLLVVGEQVANFRQDLDTLWDNFFIETCDDWVVPYIGGLVGTNLLQQPIGQSNRLDVRNTVIWRRSKGTPQMLGAVANSVSGWPSDLAEFFRAIGWSQNMNHVRLDRPLTPDLRDALQLRLLGQAADPFAHAADFRPAKAMDQSRVMPQSSGLGIEAFGTPGRYQIKNLGVFVRRLLPLAVQGATPAAAAPGDSAPADSSLFAFNPLFRDAPLFDVDSANQIMRAAFAANPWEFFGNQSSIAVRQFGVLLAADAAPQIPDTLASQQAFTFGGMSSITLDSAAGMRLMAPGSFQLGAAHFLISAQWRGVDNTTTNLGVLSTLLSSLNQPSFMPGGTATVGGQLAISVLTGRGGAGGPASLVPSPAARFPGAVVAIRAARTGALHVSDALYVYLPPSFVKTSEAVQYFVADDGSTYTDPSLPAGSLVRPSEGQVYPASISSTSTQAATTFTELRRTSGGMVLPDAARFGAAQVFIQAEVFTGTGQFQALGAIATVDQASSDFPGLNTPPSSWPAFTYAPSIAALTGNLPSDGLLSILARPLAGDFIPAAELVITNRAGRSLLVYLPEVSGAPTTGVQLLVADDGSTWFAPTDSATQLNVLAQQSLSGVVLARPAQGQTLPMPGVWPLQQRIPVAANLCRSERTSLLKPGELGIDPELGRFALPPGDPALAEGGFSVDYVEALSAAIGANTQRQLASTALPTRLVSISGDAAGSLTEVLQGAPVHTGLADAIAAAGDGEIIEVVDSATYSSSAPILLSKPNVQNLTIRAAAGQRPCFTFYSAPETPSTASLLVTTEMNSLMLDGLFISGGTIFSQSQVEQLNVYSCTLDPQSGAFASLASVDTALASATAWLISRSITGGLRLGPGVGQLTVADSILDQKDASVIAGLTGLTSPPSALTLQSDTAARTVQLERVTVFGAIVCEVLQASECLFDDLVIVQDQQSGCVRFTRFERGSILPRRFQCIPNDTQLASCNGNSRCLPPAFNSRLFGRPGYAQLSGTCSSDILTASESGAEVGAFASSLNTIRLRNMITKLQEFMPVGLSAVTVAET